MPVCSPDPAAQAGPRLPAHSSSPSCLPFLRLPFLVFFVPFCCLSSALLSPFPFFLALAFIYCGWFSPPHPLCEAGEGCEGRPVPIPGPPDARPLWGALCLMLGLCEPVCARARVWEPRPAPCRLGALGVRTLPSATPVPLYYPSYIIVGGQERLSAERDSCCILEVNTGHGRPQPPAPSPLQR